MRYIVNNKAKIEKAEYATRNIVSQSIIQHPKSRILKRDGAINTRSTKKVVTTNAISANIYLISKEKIQIMILLNTLKNFVLQPNA